MDAYKLLIKQSVGRALSRRGSKSDRQRIIQKIRQLATNPGPLGSEKLAGYDDRFRIRPGSIRVIDFIDDEWKAITVFEVGDRKEVYR